VPPTTSALPAFLSVFVSPQRLKAKKNRPAKDFWRNSPSKVRQALNPQIWQRAVFSGILGDDTKEMADLVRRQLFPNLNLDDHTRIQIGGINDAVCIALWARQTLK